MYQASVLSVYMKNQFSVATERNLRGILRHALKAILDRLTDWCQLTKLIREALNDLRIYQASI